MHTKTVIYSNCRTISRLGINVALAKCRVSRTCVAKGSKASAKSKSLINGKWTKLVSNRHSRCVRATVGLWLIASSSLTICADFVITVLPYVLLFPLFLLPAVLLSCRLSASVVSELPRLGIFLALIFVGWSSPSFAEDTALSSLPLSRNTNEYGRDTKIGFYFSWSTGQL